MPGLFSLYLFTNKQPPTLLTVTAWMTFLSPHQQTELRDEFARMPSPRCVIRNRTLAIGWATFGAAGDAVKLGEAYQVMSSSPLVRYINETFVTLQAGEGYEFMMERDTGPARD
jgi:hypothetical protein